MRDKLNNNPVAQIAVIAILLVGGAVLFLSGMGGGGDAATTAPPATPATATDPAAVDPAAAAAAASGAPVPVTSAAPVDVPVPPPPAPVQRAYKSGKTVVLLVVRGGGIDDKLVATTVRKLSGIGSVAVFVAPAKRIARYAAITLGVNVDRVPALVVVRPRRLSGGIPQASVTYGFQSAASIVQAVTDASYVGPVATYHPN